MRAIIDIECNGLKPDKIWVAAAKDIDTGEEFVFRRPDQNDNFREFCKDVRMFIGHNILGYDQPVINKLIGDSVVDPSLCVDTLVVSRLIDFARPGGHSLESFSEEVGVHKPKIDNWDDYSEEFVERCLQDCRINLHVFRRYERYIFSEKWSKAFRLEHQVATYCRILEENGFTYGLRDSLSLKEEIISLIIPLEDSLKEAFPKERILVREVVPKATKFGTISLSSLPKALRKSDLTKFTVGVPFPVYEFREFNPGSAKQRIERLWEAGWKPTEKTKGHKAFLKARIKDPAKKEYFDKYGWTTSEENLSTLPETAPEAARRLAHWLLLIARTRRLTEWENACTGSLDDPRGVRIHGSFSGIGTWTHRMAHSAPNMGNVPRFNPDQPETTPYSDRLRALWKATPGWLLIGVDAESIQLRVLAHYINDLEFTRSLLEGEKIKGTDPHSVNQRALGEICKSRDAAKTFIYGWLLGAGVRKVADILQCSAREAEQAVKNFLDRYENLGYLKRIKIPKDAQRGYFEGFDGRYVRCKGEDQGSREHYMLGGYLQNGEAVVMKTALGIWYPRLEKEKIPFRFVNFVHDEFQVETPEDFQTARYIADVIADSIRQAGESLELHCPMAGSYQGHGIDGTSIGKNWFETH